MPDIAVRVFTVAVTDPGTVFTGASFTGSTVMLLVCNAESSVPSFTVQVTVRTSVLGSALVLLYGTCAHSGVDLLDENH